MVYFKLVPNTVTTFYEWPAIHGEQYNINKCKRTNPKVVTG